MLKVIRKPVETVEETKEETKMNWSLKKKVLVGLGVLGTAALGVFAYGKLNPEEEVTCNNQESRDEDQNDYDDEELRELEAMEKAEETQE